MILQLRILQGCLQVIYMSGKVLKEWKPPIIPASLAQLRTEIAYVVLQDQTLDTYNVRTATDGYSYSRQQYQKYYGDAWEGPWQMAGRRSLSFRLLSEETSVIITDENAYLYLLQQKNVSKKECEKQAPKVIDLYSTAGREQYIEPCFWPHEQVEVPVSLDPYLTTPLVQRQTSTPTPAPEASCQEETQPWPAWIQTNPEHQALLSSIFGHHSPRERLDKWLNAGLRRSNPPFVIAYATEGGRTMNSYITDRWPQTLHFSRHQLELSSTWKGMLDQGTHLSRICTVDIAPSHKDTYKNVAPPHCVLARIYPDRYSSAQSLLGTKLQLALAGWPHHVSATFRPEIYGELLLSPLSRLRTALISFYGPNFFVMLCHTFLRVEFNQHRLPDSYLD